MLEKNKNIGLYSCLKILTTSLLFSVGLSWNAKAEAISSLPNEELVRWDKVAKIQSDDKSIELKQVQAVLGGAASPVAGQTLYTSSLHGQSNLDSSSTIPLLVKQPKSQPNTVRLRTKTQEWSQKSEVRSQKSKVNAVIGYAQGTPASLTAKSQKSTPVKSQKSTPWLDFIATPDPNSQQEFLTYLNSIESQPVTLLPLGETSFLSSKQKSKVSPENLNIFTNSQQVPEGLCLSLQGIPCTPPAMIGGVPSTESRKNAIGYPIAARTSDMEEVAAGFGGAASAVAGKTLSPRSLHGQSTLDSSSTIPLLVKQPKSQPNTVRLRTKTKEWSQKSEVRSQKSEVRSQKSKVNAVIGYAQGTPASLTAKSQKSTPVKSQKSTPWLDFIATPDPNSQQEFLTYLNSIESQPVTLLPLGETSFLSSKQKPKVSPENLNIFTNSQQVPEGLCLSLQGRSCTPPAMIGGVPSTESRENAIGYPIAARTSDMDEVAAGFGGAASVVTGKTLYTLSHDNSDKDNSDKDNSDKVEAGEGCLTCFDNTVVRNGSETLASPTVISNTVISNTVISNTVISNTVISNTVISNTVSSNTLIVRGLQGEGATLAPRRDAGELPSLISAVPHSPSSAKGTPEYPTLNRRIEKISPILIGQEKQPPEAETSPPTDTETPIQTTPQTEQLPDFSQPTTPPQESTTPPEETTTPPEEPRVLVAEVAVMGVEGELKDIVYQAIDTEPGRTTTRSQLQEDVNAVYATGFFQNVEVTPEDTPLGVRITFLVKSNPVLNQVKIQTLPPEANKQVLPPEKLDEIFQDTYGVILNLQELQDGIKKINEWYSENGYELAQVVGSPEVSPDGIVTLIVTEGIIETIQVQFFDKENEPIEGVTRDFIVTREVQLKPGDVFKRNIAQRDLQRVFGLGLFEDVRLSFSPGEDPSKVVLNVEVVESSTGSVSAGGGFSSASGFFGTISYQQQNLGGNNQTISGEFQGGERELLFDLNFTDPWIGGDPYRTSYNINFFRRRSISLVFDGDDNDIETEDGEDSPRVVRTGGGVNFARPLADNPFTRAEWNLSTGFRYQRVQIKNADGDISPRSTEEDGNKKLAFSDSGEDDLFILRFGAIRDRRNNRFQPTRGYLLRLSLDQSLPIGSGTIALNRIRASYSYFIPVSFFNFTEGPQALAFNAQAGSVVGDLPPYEAFVLGGSNSVRGYREGEVGSGRRYFQGTVEYRFPVFRIIGAALFFDYGSVLGTDADVPGTPSRIRGLPGNGYGYGAGVRIQSPLGPIRIDYGINDEDDTRIHFGIGERF